jgi:hypothetical protein
LSHPPHEQNSLDGKRSNFDLFLEKEIFFCVVRPVALTCARQKPFGCVSGCPLPSSVTRLSVR